MPDLHLFYGTYTHSVDPAGRFVMPKVFREKLGYTFLITKGLNCLWCLTNDFLDSVLAPAMRKLNQNPIRGLFDPDVIRWTRHLFADMIETKPDNQYRVPLSHEHRKYARITETVVICGRGLIIEIWSPEALEEYMKSMDSERDIVASAEALRPLLSTLLDENTDVFGAQLPHSGNQERNT
ncbi:MAG: division/cell wall cluster transcriptional repressor MraZ [Armatimonadota bacterium]